MHQRVVPLAALLISISLGAAVAQDAWVARDIAGKNMELKTAILNQDVLYIATKSVLYKTKDAKDRWESVFTIPAGGNNEINCIAGRAKTIFIGTKHGLFRSEDYGASWKKVFKTILADRNNITYIELSKHNRFKVLIGTERGIFLSEDLGNKWQEISGGLKDTPVRCLALNKELMYAGTESGLYVMRPDSDGWQRAFVRSAGEKSEAEEPGEYAYEESEKDMSIRCIAINDSRVYVAYDKDILYSDDGAKSWNSFSNDGLKGSVNYILISPKNKTMHCATAKGVFEFSDEKARWLELYRGMTKSLIVNRLIFAGEDEKVLLAVTDKGLYSFEGGDYMIDKYPDIERSVKTLKIILDGEPTFKELRDAAIKYAEVSPEKIKKWRAESKVSALLPKVSFGADRNTTDLWHWESGSSTKTGDDVLVPGQDSVDWGATVSWELGNIIWNDDQTNIDVRSRLMVQLRNDILDDLRRTYYERKRLQFELMSGPPKDMNTKFEKELRLQELTQAIDDLTGNYFSDHIQKK
ncbi:MAG: hypothetical protein Q8R14_00420 [Candidatus Omnitrophota bacterium]|nr:hypothetical protein [Candidatus Omnitrophota bacterium]